MKLAYPIQARLIYEQEAQEKVFGKTINLSLEREIFMQMHETKTCKSY